MSSVLYFLHGLKRWGPDCTVLQSQKHPTGMFLMGSPCAPLAPARRAFQLQTAAAVCHQKTRRPSSRVPPSAWGARLPTFFFSFKKKVGQRKMRPSERASAFCGRRPGGAAPSAPPPPFEKGGPKLYRPSALLAKTPGTDYRLSARLSPRRGRVGRDTGGTPAKLPRRAGGHMGGLVPP